MPMLLPIFASGETSRVRGRMVGLSIAAFIFGFGVLTVFGAAAQAAEATAPQPWSQLPLKGPAQAASFDSTGFYVGCHVGYRRGTARASLVDDDTANFTHSFGSLIASLHWGYNYVLPSRPLLAVEAAMSFLT